MDKSTDVEVTVPSDELKRTTSITSDSNGNTVIEHGDGETYTIDRAAERRLVWKFDLHILPLLAVMYLFNALDKANLGNAKTAGLEKDLNMDGTNQYNIILSIFFVPYVLTAPFLAILGKKYGPSRVLPAMMFSFGSMTLLVVAAYNFGGLFALRWFLGMAESAFFPLVIYYQTQFYRRGELGRRLAIFYAASNIAYAFGGLLAFGTFQIENAGLDRWRWLFVIEGSLTICMSIVAFIFLPYSAAYARFLTEDEKKLAFYRMQVDSSAVVNEKFVFRDAIAILKEPTSWIILGIEMCLGIPLQSVGLFLPQIVARLGYGTIKTNLYTVAPNVTGAVMLLVLGFASDYTRWRFPFVALGFFFTFMGFVIYAAIDVESSLQVAYFACFMMTWGTSAPSVLLDTWFNNNIAHEGRRVLLTSIGIPLANLMGIVSSNIFRPQDAPDYIPALVTTAAFGATGIVLTLSLGAFMIFDNKRRDRKQGTRKRGQDVSTALMRDGPKTPDFRWYY
ncbi:hypothetical protein WHR41_06353 [Cladosporium halotolerans]|uniref:Major facilitator superfamily (MFS) profile domain-containing protein n=1 Tax=Cladosporium halotolerans TaxID=1052096 RepID=A0AB34KLK7_9PEZI